MTSGDETAATETPSSRDRVVEHVRRLIESGALRPGDRLPGERDLALELGLSRPSVCSVQPMPIDAARRRPALVSSMLVLAASPLSSRLPVQWE